MTSYEPLFAKYYDYLVHDRREAFATDEEIAFVKEAFSSKCDGVVREVLDVGCGAGRYLVPLAKEGFHITGIDNSSDMLAHCHARLAQRGLQAKLIELDLLRLPGIAEYDAILCMNSVLSYFVQTKDILKALALFLDSLRPGGLLVLEIWNIFAITATFGKTSNSEVSDGSVRIVSTEHSWYEPFRSIYHGRLDVRVVDGDERHAFSREEILRATRSSCSWAYALVRDALLLKVAASRGRSQ